MILNAEALDVLAYLKTIPGNFVSLAEISRRAGGRRRFDESPSWAKHLMLPLREAGLIEINARGHYRIVAEESSVAQEVIVRSASTAATWKTEAGIVGDDYFPKNEGPRIVAGDYFSGDD